MNTVSTRSNGLKGLIFVPGDKSISHRALMFGSLANGTTHISGLLESEDVLRTAEAMTKLGAVVQRASDGSWQVIGADKLHESDSVIDMGNAGTGVRLLMGLVSTLPFKTTFIGDPSLSSRPMGRVIKPLSQNGATFESNQERLPLTVIGSANPSPITYTLPVASAQVKSAVLLAGLNTEGTTKVIEPVRCRDHTERMLKAFGADIERTDDTIILKGKAKLKACNVQVPADISSAAFPIVAALITPNSDITIPAVGINPLRAGILDVLIKMGADIRLENQRDVSGEPVADIHVLSSSLKGIDVPAEIAPSMIDEYPILAIAAAFAKGKTTLHGLAELKVKESDRFSAILNGLSHNGVACSGFEDVIEIQGNGKIPCGGALIEAKLDHRIAMSFLIMGMATQTPVKIDDISSISTSFPNFITLMNNAGAHFYDYSD